ncbi:hypothetical protein DF186_20250, partial [Enterococcus hirae]
CQQAHTFGTGLTDPQHALRAVHLQHGAQAEYGLQLHQRRRASGQAANQQETEDTGTQEAEHLQSVPRSAGVRRSGVP